MSGRPVSKRANIALLKKLAEQESVLEIRPIVAVVMRACGCTFTEIAEVFGVSRQQADNITKSAQNKL